MRIEYVYDQKHKKKAVIVPIELWEKIYKKKKRKIDFRKYRGIYKNKNYDLDAEVKKLRDEWEREL